MALPARDNDTRNESSVDHPFAAFLRIIGRGPRLSRPLDDEEAEAAMDMVLANRVEPAQLGALFLVLRLRGEVPAELAGFVRAARRFWGPLPTGCADLDWPSYADRHKQLPYFLLAALLLAESGVRVAMHGLAGEGAATTPATLRALGIAPASGPGDAVKALEKHGFAYLPIETFSPSVADLFTLRPVLGVRSPANSFARATNPTGAPAAIVGVFHPTYIPIHQEAARLLGQPRLAVFKGGGGEAQRNPDKPCRCGMLIDKEAKERTWPALTDDQNFRWRDEALDPDAVAALWRGERTAPAPEAAVVGTAAIALELCGRADSPEAATALARDLWLRRPKTKYGR